MTPRFYKQNRLRQLQAFCFAARTGSISAAAAQMLLSQPAATLLVQGLEKELGKHLFERRGPRIRLTKAGKILLDLALPLLEGFDSLAATFNERCNNRLTGNLVVAAGESATLYLLPETVKQFTEKYPPVQLQLINVPDKQALELLRTGAADIAIGPITEIPEDIYYLPITSYEPVLITPAGHPLSLLEHISLEDICFYPLILPPSTMSFRQHIDRVFQEKNLRFRLLMEAGSWEVIKKYVETGLGISIIASICLTGKENFTTTPLKAHFTRDAFGILLRDGKYLSPAARCFIELIDSNASVK